MKTKVTDSLPSREMFQGAQESSASIVAGRSRKNSHVSAFVFLQLAAVTDVNTNEEGRWDGFLTVKLLTIEGTREKVKMTLAASGNGLFVGGPPEVDAILVIGWLPSGRPVVLSQVPFSIEALYQRKDLPDLIPGEYLIRSGVQVDGLKIGGASILWDRNGRVIIKDQDERIEVTVGPPLDPSTGEVSESPITGSDVRLRIRGTDTSGDSVLDIEIDDGGGLRVRANRVDLIADQVNVGEDVGDSGRLVTKGWVDSVFKTHMHPTAATGAPSIPTPQTESGLTGRLRSK